MGFISERIAQMKPYVAGKQLANSLKLNTNEGAYPPSPKVRKVLGSIEVENLRRYPTTDSNALRETLAKHYSVDKEMVYVGNGSDEILAMCFMTFLDDKTEKIAYPEITYLFYDVYANFFQTPKIIIPNKDDFSVDLSEYNDVDAKVIILANPNAPTGSTLTSDEIEIFANANSNKLVIVDEAYGGLGADSVVPLTKKYDNILVVNTMSKSYSLAGIRCGYAIGNAELILGLQCARDCFNAYPLDTITEKIAIEALKDIEYYDMINGKIIATRTRIYKEFRDMGYKVIESRANFLFVRPSNISAKKLYKELARKNVLVRYWDSPRISEYLRITIGTDVEMDILMNYIVEIVNAG